LPVAHVGPQPRVLARCYSTNRLTECAGCLVTALATRGHAAVPPPRTRGCMRATAAAATVNCRVAVTCFAAAATCLLTAVPFLSSLTSTAALLLPPLRPPAALLLRHFEKLPPSSLRHPPPLQRAARSKPRPTTVRLCDASLWTARLRVRVGLPSPPQAEHMDCVALRTASQDS
jgi:hypothetical protein